MILMNLDQSISSGKFSSSELSDLSSDPGSNANAELEPPYYVGI
jgi:hypothetical protein